MENNMNNVENNPVDNAPKEAEVVETPKVEPEVVKAEYFKNKRKQFNTVTKLEMPTGIFMEVRRPDITVLVKNGIIPADAAVDISMLIERAGESQKNGTKFNISNDEYKKYMEIVDKIVLASVVNPKVKEGEVTDQEYDDGIISVDDIEQVDKEFIFSYANSGVTDLKPFRQKE